MPDDSSSLFQRPGARVIATISSPAGLEQARKLDIRSADCPDWLEVRVDLLLENTPELPGTLAELLLPVLLTVRHPSEGGKAPSDPSTRAEIFRRRWSEVAAIDVELASVSELRDLIDEANDMQLACVFSFHDFQGTPSIDKLQEMTQSARDAGASLFKVAATTNTVAELSTLLNWVESERTLPVAAMGMGRLGKISRPLLAQLGSRLNYGYLDAPVVSGQWPAAELQRLIRSLP